MSISASLELESPSKKERKINIFNELWTICVGNYLLVIYRIAFRLAFWRCGRCAYASVPRYRCRRSLLMVWVGYGTTRTDCGWRRDMVYIWYLISVMSTSHINIYLYIYISIPPRREGAIIPCCSSVVEELETVCPSTNHLWQLQQAIWTHNITVLREEEGTLFVRIFQWRITNINISCIGKIHIIVDCKSISDICWMIKSIVSLGTGTIWTQAVDHRCQEKFAFVIIHFVLVNMLHFHIYIPFTFHHFEIYVHFFFVPGAVQDDFN